MYDIFSSQAAASRGYVDCRKALAGLSDMGAFNRKFWGLLSLEIRHQQFADLAQSFRDMLSASIREQQEET